jgi:hypothetical protein
MAVTAAAEGSTTPTVGSSESNLGSTLTTAGVYQLWIDTNAMVGGTTPDILIVRFYGKARTGDTERLIDEHSLIGAQSVLLWVSKPYAALYSFRAAIVQSQGTARAFPWSIRAM